MNKDSRLVFGLGDKDRLSFSGKGKTQSINAIDILNTSESALCSYCLRHRVVSENEAQK